jgi:hypothetical protein
MERNVSRRVINQHIIYKILMDEFFYNLIDQSEEHHPDDPDRPRSDQFVSDFVIFIKTNSYERNDRPTYEEAKLMVHKTRN